MVKTGADQQPLFYLKHMISIKSDGDKGGGTPGIRRDVMEAALFEALQGQIKISARLIPALNPLYRPAHGNNISPQPVVEHQDAGSGITFVGFLTETGCI